MTDFWDRVAEDQRKQEEEEEKRRAEEKKRAAEAERQDKARASLSFWERAAYDQIKEDRGEEVLYNYGKGEASTVGAQYAAGELTKKRHAGRQQNLFDETGTKTVSAAAEPEEKTAQVRFGGLRSKRASDAESGSAGTGIRNTYAESEYNRIEGLREQGPYDRANAQSPAPSSARTESGIRNTYVADRMEAEADERNERLQDEAYRDATVRNQTWLDGLRPAEEIEAELEEARKVKNGREKQKGIDLETALTANLLNTTEDYDRFNARYDSGIKEASDRVTALEDELATRMWAEYERNRNNADFAEKSGYRESGKTVTGKQGVNKLPDIEYEDPLHEWVNGDDNARYKLDLERDKLIEGFGGGAGDMLLERLIPTSEFEYAQTREMTSDELAMYNYLYNTQGADAANGYLRYLQSDLFARQAETEKAAAAERAKEHPIDATLETVVGTPLKGLSYIAQTANQIAGNGIDPNAPYNRLVYLPRAERQAVTQIVENNWGKFGTFAYGVGTSMLDFLWTNAVSLGYEPVALALMGTGAAADATVEAKERGLSDAQAYALGTIAGFAEIITEKVSIENLFTGKWESEPLRYLLKNTIAEGSEEGASDLINWFADILITKNKSEWMTEIADYKANHPRATDGEAFIAALKSKGGELLLDMASGALSGFLMAAGPAAVGAAKKRVTRSGDIEAVRAASNETKQRQAQADEAEWIMLPTAEEDANFALRTAEQTAAETQTGAETQQTGAEETAEETGTRTEERTEAEAAAENEAQVEAETGKEDAETGTVLPTQEEIETRDANTEEDADIGNPRFGTRAENESILQTAEESETDAAVRKALDEGNVTRATGIRHGADESTIRLAERVGKTTGRTVEFYSQDAVNGTITNGFTSGGKIYYNVKAKQPFLFTFSHEFTHNLEGTKAYDALMDRAKTRTLEQGGDWLQKRAKTRRLYERAGAALPSNSEIDQELLADWVADNLGDERTIREIVRDNPSTGKRILDGLAQFVAKIGDMTGMVSPYEEQKIRNVTEGLRNAMRAYNSVRNFAEQSKNASAEKGASEEPEKRESGASEEETAGEGEKAGEDGEETNEREEKSTARKTGAGAMAAETRTAADQYRARIEERYDAGEITDEQYDEAMALADEMESTGRSFEEPAVKEEGGEGKRGRAVKRLLGRQSSISEQTVSEREAEPMAVNSDGEVLTGEIRNGTVVKYSLSSWNATDKEKVAQNLANAGFTPEEIDTYIQNVNGIAAKIAEDRGRLDYDAATNQVYMKTNEEYVVTLDASTLCAKRLLYQGTFDKIQHILQDRVLTPEDLIDLSNMLGEAGYQTPCGICYVESRRRHLGRFASEWLKKYKGDYIPTLDELTTTDGLESLRKSHPDIYKQFNDAMNAKGSANPKVVQLRTDYRGDINNLTKGQIEKIIRIGGLRIQSFSDFETPHLIDMMQAVLDMAAKKLTAQAYTKVPNFAWVFGDTGIKINLSLIGDVDQYGRLTFSSVEGMDMDEAMKLRDRYPENVGTVLVGKTMEHILAAMADDRIDFIIPFHQSGWSKEEMEMMKSLEGFVSMQSYKNERIILGKKKKSETRKTQKGVDGWLQKNEGKYSDVKVSKGPDGYTIEYTDGYETESFATHKERTGEDLSNFTPTGPEQYWDYNKTGKENAVKYLKMCADAGRMPKFWNFLVDNGDGSFSLQPDGSTDGYWKLLIDFKMYDNNGVGAPQREVRPNFNMTEAERVLKEYKGGANEMPSASDEFIDNYVRHYKEAHGDGKKYSISPEWENEIDEWNANGRQNRQWFTVGSTSDVLRSIGVKDREIKWLSNKINRILNKHKSMTLDVIKQVPNVIENPVIVLKSRTVDRRITAFGEVYDTNGTPVLAVLDIQPTSDGCEIEDIITVNSAYGKDKDLHGFIMNSDVLYVDPDTKRTDDWLKSVRLQLPSAPTNIGSIGSITYSDGEVNISGEKSENIFEETDEAGGENFEQAEESERPSDENQYLTSEYQPDYYNRTALLKEDTVDEYLRDYAAKSSPNYAQAYITRMDPNQFLDLTTSTLGRIRIGQETGPFDEETFTRSTRRQPLQIRIEDGKVVGHEGRHRANALARAGVMGVPVLVFDSSNKYDKTDVPEMRLSGQDFGNGNRSYKTAVLRDLIPLSYANRDRIVEKFGQQNANERMQEKYGNKRTLRYSLSEADEEYMKAYEDHDEYKEQILVNEAAEAAGYDTPEIYHGTRGFGFTKFDLELGEKMIFATSDPRIARTYSGETDRTRITDRTDINADNLHGEELLRAAQEYLGEYRDHELMTDADKAEYADGIRSRMTRTLEDAAEFVNDNEHAFDAEKMKIADRLLNALSRMGDARTEEDLDAAWQEWSDALWELKWADESIADEFMDKVMTRDVTVNKNMLSDFMSGRDIYAKKDPYGIRYVFDNQLQIELGAETHKGVYTLYGRTGRQLVVEGNGANWNQITPPEELNLYGPQRTRDIAEAAKAAGYDSVLFKDIRDAGGETDYNGRSDVYVFFREDQVKSADPETYDDEGNVILPSERFKPEKKDIRWSVSEAEPEGDDTLSGMPQGTKSAVMKVERQLVSDILQALGRDLRPGTLEYRQFRSEAVRPVTEAILRGETPDADELMIGMGLDIVQQTAERASVQDALRRAVGELGRITNNRRQIEARRQRTAERNAQLDAMIPADDEGLVKLGNDYKDVKTRWARIRGASQMDDEGRETAHKIATGQMTAEEAYAQNPFGMDEIMNLAEAEKAFLDAAGPWERHTKKLAQQRLDDADAALRDANADRAKDKASGFRYARETAERNFRDVFGKDAEGLIDKYVRPVHEMEAASTRFKNAYNERVKELGISRKVARGNTASESYAVQFLGEAEDNVRVLTLLGDLKAVRDGMNLSEWQEAIEDFKAANPRLDYDKIHGEINKFSQIYDELIRQMNAVLVRSGYLPVNTRRGYFPHFTQGNDGVLASFAKLIGIGLDQQALPTSINGLTSRFKPGKTWFSHALERTGFRTDYDALYGFENYLKGVSDVIHQTSNIRNLRALSTMIRYNYSDEGIKKKIRDIEADENLDEAQKIAAIDELHENGRYKLSRFVPWLDEYTNQLANKKSKYDRAIEDLMGRRVYSWMKNMEGRVAANMIAGNLGSALTNFIPLNQAGAMIGRMSLLKGAFQTMTNRARGDDFVNRSDFLTNRRGVDPLFRGKVDAISDFLSKPMNLIDNFVSETIVRGAYDKYIRQGMDEQSAMQAADEFAAGVMADRSKGALPTIFGSHNPLTKLFTQFQVEVNNEWSTLFKDIPKGMHLPDKEKKNLAALAAWTLMRYFVGAYLFNDLYEKIVGRRAALDPISILNDAVGDFSGYKINNIFDMISEGVIDKNKPANTSDMIGNLVKGAGEELPFVGGLFFGGGRIPIKSALPDFETIGKGLFNDNWDSGKKLETVGREIGKSVGTYILPPFAGGLGKKLWQTGENAIRGGRYVKDAEGNDQLQYPYFTDTPLETAGTVLKSALFGPTATEGGREWVEGGFGSQSAKNTAMYQTLIGEYGESSRAAWDLLSDISSGERGRDTQAKRAAVAESGLSYEGKAYAMEVLTETKTGTEPQRFRAAYDNGVSPEAWAALYGAMREYDENGNKQYNQSEIRAELDNLTVPVSFGEGAAAGLFGESTEERYLTNREKAALWQAYNPAWSAKNNPYSAEIGEQVIAKYNQLKNEKEGEE